MSAQHTPGPWIGAGPSFGEKPPQYIDEIVTDRDDENDCCTICTLPFAFNDAEQEANARLIAAAPDLLAALRKIADHYIYKGHLGAVPAQRAEAWRLDYQWAKEIARTAIAKVEGGAS